MSKCDCNNIFLSHAGQTVESTHKKTCPKYATEKHPYLMYYEDAIDCWTFAPDDVESIVSVDNFAGNEVKEIEFKVVWLTDKEVDEMPEG